MKTKILGILAFALAFAFSARGKTIALWPINYDDTVRTASDIRCRIDPANDLSVTSLGKVCEGAQWTYPPNLDLTLPADFTKNAYAISNGTALAKVPVLWSGSAGRHLVRTNDFTVEGWIKFSEMPTSSGWFYIVGAMEGSQNYHRWFFSLREVSSKLVFVFATPQSGDVRSYLADIGESAESLTNGWRHLAISHDANDGNGHEVWNVYLDGTGILTSTQAIPSFAGPPSNLRFDLGGRTSGNNSTPALFDYWRISNTVLTPEQFLCHGGAGTTPSATSTVAYWKLDLNSDGTINVKPSVGSWEMNGFVRTTNQLINTGYGMDSESAFDGFPPNMNMSPAPSLRIANAGSLHSAASGGSNSMLVEGLGTHLTLTNNFTIEGWFKPVRTATHNPLTIQFLALTRMNASGWQFGFKRAGSWRLFIYASDGISECCPDTFLSGDLSDWYDWRHVVLTYTADEGNGTWRCYLDGALAGEAENQIAPGASATYGEQFALCGRPGSTNRSFQGKVDYVRVTERVLLPAQFLVTENGTAATDVLALWPLNTTDGAYFDGRDCMGNYNYAQDVTTEYRARPSDSAPAISNPDTSPEFVGDPSSLNGSVRFYDTTASETGARATLGTFDPAALNLINTATNMTVECYIRRNGTTGTSWEHIFASHQLLTPTGASGQWFGLCYKAGTGFYIVDKFWSDATDQPFAGTDGLADDGAWHHLALTRTFGDDTVAYTLFFDGTEVANINREVTRARKGTCIYIGGRTSSANSFRGAISSLRFSNKVLAPSEFLNASGNAHGKDALALWPLDSINGALDVSSLTNSFFSFQKLTSAAGSPTQVASTVLKGKTLPDSIQNAGSVLLSDGELSARNLGAWMPPSGSGTVEGWIKWDGTDGVVAGIFENGCGWKLFVENGALKLYGTANSYSTPYVDGTLLADVSSFAGQWTHIALVYDNGCIPNVWRLYVDRSLSGTLENLWMPSAESNSHLPDFRLGGTISGNFDMWRISHGTLASDEFLSLPPGGLVISVR